MDAKMILYLIIGLMITRRTVHLLKIINIIGVANQKWLRCLYLITCIMLLLLMRIEHTNWFWMLALVCFGIPIFVAELVERRRTRLFTSETREFYDELVFEIRSGNSLRSSLDRIIVDTRFGFYTREMVEVALKNSSDDDGKKDLKAAPEARFRKKLIEQRVFELCRLLRANGKVLERLQFHRHVHQLEQKFVRKSRIATRQVRAQAIIVIAMYAGLLGLQVYFGMTQFNSVFVLLSLSLILVGVGALFYVMRSFKWRV